MENPKKNPLVSVSEFDFFLKSENISKWSRYLLFLGLLIFIYIANSHYANKVVVKTATTTARIKELRSEYISIKKDLMNNSRQTEVFKRLEGSGMKPLGSPPEKIFYHTNSGSRP